MTRLAALPRRWDIVVRALLAVFGGYALTSLVNLAVPLLLSRFGIDQAQALLAMTMASFLLYAAIIMAVFHARSALRAFGWLLSGAVAAGVTML